MKRVSIFVAMCISLFAIGQNDSTMSKVAEALKTDQKIKIDGILNEPAWSKAAISSGMFQRSPSPGKEASFETNFSILYDNEAIYFGAKLNDIRDSISTQLSERDALTNSDWMGLLLSPYKDGINGVGFILTAKGVQFDTKYSALGEDVGWDAVWDGEVTLVEDGWVVEMMIPYSALRFPDSDEQEWQVNVVRNINRLGETSFWSNIDRTVNGFLNQFGLLKGIQNISSPVRLSATPFIAGYLENYNNKSIDNPQNSSGKSFNAGMDIKYGLSDAFTLDMTLIPDFGEAQSDNQVLNLSPFEVRFDENRQFFTEGTELFNKGGLFYSRRAGGSPFYSADDFTMDDEEVIEAPQQDQLINATKISGRTKKGTGLGFFNAISSQSNAILKSDSGIERTVAISPLTNYNVLVVDQNLKNNSYVTLINTNVTRKGEAYDANVTGFVFDLKNKEQSYNLSGAIKSSQLLFDNSERFNQHVDNLPFLREEDKSELTSKNSDTSLGGFAYELEVNKISGKFNAGIGYDVESHTYDINDLGFLRTPNSSECYLNLNYNEFNPFGNFNAMGAGMYVGYESLYKPNVYSEIGINLFWWFETKNFWNGNIWTYGEPKGEHNYFEPRTPGRYLEKPKFAMLGFNIGSDSRKKSTFFFNGSHGRTLNLFNGHYSDLGGGTFITINDRLSFEFESNGVLDYNDLGFVSNWGENDEDIIIGKRDILTMINSLSTVYSFNKNMGLNLRVRHYWSNAEYNEFHELSLDGQLLDTDYNGFHDVSYNFFNIDMVYRWRFAPGSDIFMIWKNSISDVSDTDTAIQYDYGNAFQKLNVFPQRNSLSLKVVYYLDYVNFFNT